MNVKKDKTEKEFVVPWKGFDREKVDAWLLQYIQAVEDGDIKELTLVHRRLGYCPEQALVGRVIFGRLEFDPTTGKIRFVEKHRDYFAKLKNDLLRKLKAAE